MDTRPVTLLTIVAEHVLRERLLEEILQAGVRGFTVYEVEGSGPRHRRISEVLGSNVKIETIVSEDLANRIMEILVRDYFPSFAVIAYTSVVSVVRGEKYA